MDAETTTWPLRCSTRASTWCWVLITRNLSEMRRKENHKRVLKVKGLRWINAYIFLKNTMSVSLTSTQLTWIWLGRAVFPVFMRISSITINQTFPLNFKYPGETWYLRCENYTALLQKRISGGRAKLCDPPVSKDIYLRYVSTFQLTLK